MKHYVETKNLNPDAFLFYRLGDFYELFFQDAIDVSKLLNLTLTKKSGGLDEKIPMCGVPYRVADQYIARLVNMGYKVAICDQVEDPKEAKGLVKREITKIVTPSTFTELDYLSTDKSNLLMAIYLDNISAYVATCNYLNGSLTYSEKIYLSQEELLEFLEQEYSKNRPVEVLILNNILSKDLIKKINKRFSDPLINELDSSFLSKSILDELPDFISQVNELSQKLNNFVLDPLLLIFNYLDKTQMGSLDHLTSLLFVKEKEFMGLSESSKINLELLSNINDNSKKNSLYELLDRCLTSMGSRMLKDWIQRPLLDIDLIKKRQQFILSLQSDRILEDALRSALNQIYDFDRLSVKISQKTLTPKDLSHISKSLFSAGSIKDSFQKSTSPYFNNLSLELINLLPLAEKISDSIIDEPSSNFMEERFIKEGYSHELDLLFKNSEGSLEWLLDLEKEEQERTGIKNLKIKYNKILGYFIEITKANLDSVPEDYIRKQTLVGSERFYTTKLKEKEEEILLSKERALEKQIELLNELRSEVYNNIHEIQLLARQISSIDCLFSFSQVADEYNYVCPEFNFERIIDIKEGRHPVVESQLTLESYVPNDVLFEDEHKRIQIITGPNMAGKSTYMRQTALIQIMAQIGSFVPAKYANLSIIDNIFTRIGASDNLASGQSTFMVEMMEVSYILNNITENSLVLLDEVGRGTSTHDGLSIAFSLVEFLAEKSKAKIFFATHYFQLTQLKEKYQSIENLTIATEKKSDEITFLRRIVMGESNHSFGIEVAKLAGINEHIISRAKEILFSLEKDEGKSIKKIEDFDKKSKYPEIDPKLQSLSKDLLSININNITPIESLQILSNLQNKLKGK